MARAIFIGSPFLSETDPDAQFPVRRGQSNSEKARSFDRAFAL
jgi:hypothetical protein